MCGVVPSKKFMALLPIVFLAACATAVKAPLVHVAEEEEPQVEIAIEVVPDPEPRSCGSDGDMFALRVAAVQQKLMVAGYMCEAAGPYNDFVASYRPDLLASDLTLQNYFRNLRGQSGDRDYDSFKTRLANLSMRESAANLDIYCVNVNLVFSAAKAAPVKSLATFLSSAEMKSDEGPHSCDLIGPSL